MFHGNDERVDQESLALSTQLWEAVARDFVAADVVAVRPARAPPASVRSTARRPQPAHTRNSIATSIVGADAEMEAATVDPSGGGDGADHVDREEQRRRAGAAARRRAAAPQTSSSAPTRYVATSGAGMP